MKYTQINILLVLLSSLIFSCSTKKELFKKENTNFGSVKYYIQTDLNDINYVQKDLNEKDHKKRIVIQVEDSVYYSFYSDRINKRTKKDKNSIYQLFYEEIPKEFDAQIAYQKLSELDSLILLSSNRILDSLKWKNFKRWNGASAFELEVIYYHGIPKNETFKPY